MEREDYLALLNTLRELTLDKYSIYFNRMAIGDLTSAKIQKEHLKALDIYLQILDYYYNAVYEITTEGSTTTTEVYGFLYNEYVLTDIVNTSQTGWRVPTGNASTGDFTDLKTTAVTAGALKDPNYWADGETATDSLNFSARAAGGRFAGQFVGDITQSDYQRATFWGISSDGLTDYSFDLNSDDDEADIVTIQQAYTGLSIRLCRDATTAELLYDDGTIIYDVYEGNDGTEYDGVKIGNLIWLRYNLRETKYNDDTDIDDTVYLSAEWTVLTEGASCYYDYDLDNAYITTTVEEVCEYTPDITDIETTDIDNVFEETQSLIKTFKTKYYG